VDGRDRVLEVDELGAERVLVARGDANIGLAEGPADDLRCSSVVWEGDCGLVFGGGCSDGGGVWCVGWVIYLFHANCSEGIRERDLWVH
jgi:hypothetical protein